MKSSFLKVYNRTMKTTSSKCPVCYKPTKKGSSDFCSEECRDEYQAYENEVLDLKDNFGWSNTVLPSR